MKAQKAREEGKGAEEVEKYVQEARTYQKELMSKYDEELKKL